MGCKPITQKAKSSPFKMNVALVQNDAQTHKGFVDVAGAMGAGMDETQKRINASEKKQQKPQVDPTPKTGGLDQEAKPSNDSNDKTVSVDKTKAEAKNVFSKAAANAGAMLANGIKK